jgi:protein NUD1
MKPRSQASVKMFVGRPISRIDEQDESSVAQDLSIVQVSQTRTMTPMQNRQRDGRDTSRNSPSLICLTPLSEFTLHQVDRPRHLEASYVAPRAHPTSLQQAHGSLTLAVDELMKAITEAEPYELYWEHIRRLDLTAKGLETLYRLEEYCTTIEELHISRNRVRQLSGVPASVRMLTARDNTLSSLTSWGHLQNLQYLDISGNELESLDGLSCLVHLRELKANRNRIRNLEGIFDLDGLLNLELRSNQITTVDFEGAELRRLDSLNLTENLLTSVRGLHHLAALRKLVLDKNSLREFPTSHDENDHVTKICRQLVDLRLSWNELEVIDLSTIPAIEVLYLDNNRISTIDGLSTARHLDTLSLREQSYSPNILSTILSTSNECRKIYLSANSPFPSTTTSSPTHLNLKYLELSSCGLTSLPTDFGQQIPNCRTLNLNFNAIGDLRPLRGCRRLNKLLVAGNRLTKLRATCVALSRLPALTKIDLRGNPVTVGFYPPLGMQRRWGDARQGQLQLIQELPSPSSPSLSSPQIVKPYTLPPADRATDAHWLTHLDEPTRLKRQAMEVFLAMMGSSSCGGGGSGGEKLKLLEEVDGLPFDREAVLFGSATGDGAAVLLLQRLKEVGLGLGLGLGLGSGFGAAGGDADAGKKTHSGGV